MSGKKNSRAKKANLYKTGTRHFFKNRNNRNGMIIVLLVAMILLVVSFVRGKQLQAGREEYLEQCTEWQQKIDEEKERKKELEEYREYMKTDEFFEWYAKEKLGLVKDNWIIFKSE